MADPQDQLDLSFSGGEGSRGHHDERGGRTSRPWISVFFECCHTYVRIYRNREGTAYEGACPKCRARVRAAVGPDGTSQRFFRAS